MTVTEFLEMLRSEPSVASCIQHCVQIPARKARTLPIPDSLAEPVRKAIERQGIEQLYSHQRRAWDLASEGRDVVVVTGTASGKTLCYNLPVLDRLVREQGARALYLFPTKALAQDQLGKLHAMLHSTGVRAATYDGDTPKEQRSTIRSNAGIILTNPDMLHIGILPNYQVWLKFLRGLRFVVLDEMHVYRGIFGSHVANILRRLFRLCVSLGVPSPQVVACSATIGNPGELAEALLGRECEVIAEDGSPTGPKSFVIWNPQVIGSSGERRSPNLDAARLIAYLVEHGIRSIGFARARVTTELLLRYARSHLAEDAPKLVGMLESYRGGYTAEERRDIERRLFGGELLGVVATNALELGIDVGGLDAAVINGYPGSVSSVWQQAGRAGRGTEPSAVFFVAHNDPLEQHLVREPSALLDARHEQANINPGNRYVLEHQLRCAVFERPMDESEVAMFGPNAKAVLNGLVENGSLEYRAGRYFCPDLHTPAADVDIRSASGAVYEIVDADTYRRLGTVEENRAFQVAHEGATYLHRGEQYLIESLDIETRTAMAKRTELSYYTEARTETVIDFLVKVAERKMPQGVAAFGSVRVTQVVTGYSMRALLTEHFLGFEPLDLPERSYETLAVWLTLRPPGDDEKERIQFGMGLHALEHTLATALPVLVGCDPGDTGSTWTMGHHSSGLPTVILFDDVPGGVGICETGFRRLPQWLDLALRVVEGCPCWGGCPACLLTPWCGNRNADLDKRAGIALLESLQLSRSGASYNPSR